MLWVVFDVEKCCIGAVVRVLLVCFHGYFFPRVAWQQGPILGCPDGVRTITEDFLSIGCLRGCSGRWFMFRVRVRVSSLNTDFSFSAFRVCSVGLIAKSVIFVVESFPFASILRVF